MVRADFLFSIVLTLLGLGIVLESWRMPRLENLGVNPYSVPGLTPGLLGLVLLLLAVTLLVRSIRAGGWRLAVGDSDESKASAQESLGRLALALFLTVGYGAGLVGRLPFWLATFLFVLLFVALFTWRPGLTAGAWAKLVAWAVLQAAVVAAVVTAVFQYLFLVQLP